MYPDLSLLANSHPTASQPASHAQTIADTLVGFRCPCSVVGESHGPVLSTYKLRPAMGVRFATINNRSVDLALALGVNSIRLTPNGDHIALEVPNEKRSPITLKEIASHQHFRQSKGLALTLGKDLRGVPYILNLDRAPHLLVAGQTGSGKSVCVNSLLISLLLKHNPDQLKLVLIDPKRVELGLYADLPHLARKIAVEPREAIAALDWLTKEMETRYKALAAIGARNIHEYREAGNSMPYIVCVVDEMADLMLTSDGKAEYLITRLTQMARAVGIHLVLATQRPSVDVITGLIKANVPTRIGMRVASKTDSRVILDTNGAETLLGQGDMLLVPPDSPSPIRLHGPFVTTAEVKRVVKFWTDLHPPAPEVKPEDKVITDPIVNHQIQVLAHWGYVSTMDIQQRYQVDADRAIEVVGVLLDRQILRCYDKEKRLYYPNHRKGPQYVNI